MKKDRLLSMFMLYVLIFVVGIIIGTHMSVTVPIKTLDNVCNQLSAVPHYSSVHFLRIDKQGNLICAFGDGSDVPKNQVIWGSYE